MQNALKRPPPGHQPQRLSTVISAGSAGRSLGRPRDGEERDGGEPGLPFRGRRGQDAARGRAPAVHGRVVSALPTRRAWPLNRRPFARCRRSISAALYFHSIESSEPWALEESSTEGLLGDDAGDAAEEEREGGDSGDEGSVGDVAEEPDDVGDLQGDEPGRCCASMRGGRRRLRALIFWSSVIRGPLGSGEKELARLITRLRSRDAISTMSGSCWKPSRHSASMAACSCATSGSKTKRLAAP